MPVAKSIIPDAELNVLKVLWEEEAPLTVREITLHLYNNTDTSSVGTVQKLLVRLEEKNMLLRDKTKQSTLLLHCLTGKKSPGCNLQNVLESFRTARFHPL